MPAAFMRVISAISAAAIGAFGFVQMIAGCTPFVTDGSPL